MKTLLLIFQLIGRIMVEEGFCTRPLRNINFLNCCFKAVVRDIENRKIHLENSRCTRWFKNPNKILCYLFFSLDMLVFSLPDRCNPFEALSTT